MALSFNLPQSLFSVTFFYIIPFAPRPFVNGAYMALGLSEFGLTLKNQVFFLLLSFAPKESSKDFSLYFLWRSCPSGFLLVARASLSKLTCRSLLRRLKQKKVTKEPFSLRENVSLSGARTSARLRAGSDQRSEVKINGLNRVTARLFGLPGRLGYFCG